MQVVGAVLVGGRSRRFGSPKALATTPDGPLAMISVRALRAAGVDPIVVVGHPERDRATAAALGLPLVADRRPDTGPLGGLATVLAWAAVGHVVVAPCDLTDLDAATIASLLLRASEVGDDVAVVSGGPDGRPDPTVAVWPTSLHRALQRSLDRGDGRWRAALEAGPFVTVPVRRSSLADADEPSALHRRFGPSAEPPRTGNEP